jgi:hypothetical protein
MKTNTKTPDPLAPFEEKITDEYGLNIAKLIAGEWFNGGMIDAKTPYGSRREYIRQKRLFVRGESGTQYFKDGFKKGDNDLDYINLDWGQINWAEKFARIVSNGIADDNYKLRVTSVDALSQVKRKRREDFYKSFIVNKQLIGKFKDTLGVDMSPQTEVPETEEELSLFMEIKDRPKIEIAEEILIDFVKKSHNWEIIEQQKNKDLVDIGIIVGRVWIDKNDGVKVEYVDPEFYIHSKVKKNDFSDKYYDGYVEAITLSDIRRESGFDEPTLREIAKTYSGQNGNGSLMSYETCDVDDLLDHKIDILRFAWKTSKTIKFKAKKRNGKTVKVSRRNDTDELTEGRDFGVLGKTLDTWLEGTYIIGTKFIYDYKECENIYNDVMNKSVSPFIAFAYDIYENKLRSFTDNIEAPARQLQKIHLKIQHLISELTPDLKEIDLDMLAELDDGKGGAKKEVWQTALEIMGAKGVIFKKRIDMGDEGGVKDQAAVRPYPTQQGSALVHLLNVWAHYYNLIRENTGVNPARDGSISPNALVGVNQMAQLASNTVTRNIVETSIMFNKRVCEVISTRLHTIFNYKDGKELQELYNNIVSKQLMDAMEILKDRHLHEFGFLFEMYPTSEDLKEFNERLNLAIQEGSIDVETVVEATNIAKSNVKMALQYLIYMRKKRMREEEQRQMALNENKSKNDAMAAQAKVQAEAEAYQIKKQTDVWFEQQKAEIEIMKQRAISEVTLPEKDREFREKSYLKQLEGQVGQTKEQYREDRKDQRLNKQSSQQSKLIEQRQLNTPAIDFERQEPEMIGM